MSEPLPLTVLEAWRNAGPERRWHLSVAANGVVTCSLRRPAISVQEPRG